jgi:hypothetical protein
MKGVEALEHIRLFAEACADIGNRGPEKDQNISCIKLFVPGHYRLVPCPLLISTTRINGLICKAHRGPGGGARAHPPLRGRRRRHRSALRPDLYGFRFRGSVLSFGVAGADICARVLGLEFKVSQCGGGAHAHPPLCGRRYRYQGSPRMSTSE